MGAIITELARTLGWGGLLVDGLGSVVVRVPVSGQARIGFIPGGARWVLAGNPATVIDQPGAHPACRDCPAAGRGKRPASARAACPASAEVAVPVWQHGEVRGVAVLGDWGAPGVNLTPDGLTHLCRLLELACRQAWESAAAGERTGLAPGGGGRQPGSAVVTFDDIKGASPALQEVKEQAALAARSDATILIVGESGTGKEMFARAIHAASSRAQGPFVAINCAAIPEMLLESEMFGYEAGAFTGARSGGKRGRLELAAGGTVFFDEIADLPVSLQPKLLRVLESKEFERVGGLRSLKVDVRVIAATHLPLDEMVRQGTFRDDLYYRLSVIPLYLPPLRERKEDIYILVEHLFRRYALATGGRPKRFSAEALDALFRYDWPGNVRELANVVEYVANLVPGDVVPLSGLPPRIRRCVEGTAEGEEGARRTATSLRELEEKAIRAALREFVGRPGGKELAAQSLGIHRSTLYRKMKKLGIAGPIGNS